MSDLVEKMLQKGVEIHKSGKVEIAWQLYSSVLKTRPEHPAANHNMGLLAVDVGKVQDALPFFKAALEANPAPTQFWLSYIDALIKLEKLTDAKAVLDQAKSKGARGDGFDKLEQRLQEADQGSLEANQISSKPQPKQPNMLDTLKLDQALKLAKKKAKDGSPEEAKRIYQDILVKFPKNKRASDGLKGLTGRIVGKPSKVQNPSKDQSQALINLYSQGQLPQALKQAETLAKQFPQSAILFNIQGVILNGLGRHDASVEAYNKALAIKPDYAEAQYNVGVTLQDQGKLEEGIEAYNKALAIKPDNAEAYNNMGDALIYQGKLEEGIEAYKKALAIKPNYADACYNMGNACLAAKDFEQGFEKQEWRWQTKASKTPYLKTRKPTWSGETRQRVLVWPEQGIGDEIMFMSIISELHATSLKTIVQCDKRLIPLFKRSFPNDITYYPSGAHVPEDEYDFHIPMGSLPLTFRRSLDSFKNSASGFLKCNMARAESIKGQLSHVSGKKLVGISWKTKSLNRNSSTRNIDLADLARALDNSKTQLVCLQYGDVSDEIETVKRDYGIDVIQFDEVDNMYDIDGLASLILACDQVVSTTNFTVHLAGALGVKVTALLPFTPRWIWGDGSESLFYESVIPIKQKYYHNWNNVLDSLRSTSYNLF